jgi:hypothetical protein
VWPCALVYVATVLFSQARVQSEWESSSADRRWTGRGRGGRCDGDGSHSHPLKGLEEDIRPEDAR